MKKILLSVFAVAALASCIQNEDINPLTPIGFGDAFVNNSTKAIYEGAKLVDEFQVWGAYKGISATTWAELYNGSTVTRPNDLTEYNAATAWNCDDKRYWADDCEYKFYAVVDDADATTVTAANGVVESINFTANGSNDLLYGYKEENTKDAIPALVAFQMNHLLSKISFKFTAHADLLAGYTYKVNSVTVANAFATGVYTVADNGTGSWASQKDAMAALTLAVPTDDAIAANGFVAASGAYVIIPGAAPLKITIEAQLLFKDSNYGPAKTFNIELKEDKAVTFQEGFHYAFNVILPTPENKIDFTISTVKGFENKPETELQ